LQKPATVALLIGLPIVLVLAWYHGDKGEQRVTRMELAILTMLFLLGGGLFWRYQHLIATVAVATSPAPAAVAIPTDHSIAVLPFVDMSQAHDQEYFSDGISEELLNLLAQVPQLRVIARTSSFSFKGQKVDVATIAKTLSVANVLEGSVRKSGDTLRITAQLIRASDSSHLWSHTCDRQMTDVFKVQDEIAATVVAPMPVPDGHERLGWVLPESRNQWLSEPANRARCGDAGLGRRSWRAFSSEVRLNLSSGRRKKRNWLIWVAVLSRRIEDRARRCRSLPRKGGRSNLAFGRKNRGVR